MNIPSVKIILVREGGEPLPGETPQAVADAARAHIGQTDREHMIVALLDVRKKITGINTVSIGSLDSSVVHPREVFKPAILGNAHAIVLAHNHPSGDHSPSREDDAVTERIKDAGKILGVPLVDHIVLGDGSFYSYAQHGKI